MRKRSEKDYKNASREELKEKISLLPLNYGTIQIKKMSRELLEDSLLLFNLITLICILFIGCYLTLIGPKKIQSEKHLITRYGNNLNVALNLD